MDRLLGAVTVENKSKIRKISHMVTLSLAARQLLSMREILQVLLSLLRRIVSKAHTQHILKKLLMKLLLYVMKDQSNLGAVFQQKI